MRSAGLEFASVCFRVKDGIILWQRVGHSQIKTIIILVTSVSAVAVDADWQEIIEVIIKSYKRRKQVVSYCHGLRVLSPVAEPVA